MALGTSVANDIVNTTLTFYVRGMSLAQNIQNKPLLAFLTAGAKTFPGGKDNISTAVKGKFMSDTAGFMVGYKEDEELLFKQAQDTLRADYPWKEVAASLIITFTELKKDGVSVSDRAKTSTHSQAELVRLTSILEERLEDFAESWKRAMNTMLWADGTQDSEQVPGVSSLIVGDNAGVTTGGLARNTYPWWRNLTNLGLAPSEANQTLTKALRHDLIQLRRYGGMPNKALCGSAFIDALMVEVQAKGLYTQEGFARSANDLGMDKIRMKGLGDFEYDPTLDDRNESKSCYILDSRRIRLRPMDGEANKLYLPERPYQYMVYLKTMTWTGALEVTQLNCMEKLTVV